MRPLLAIFSLFICLAATLAGELPVIKDVDAVRYIGKKVEVRGFVVSVITSPFGTTFINFGREYPNQIFAGFIPVGAKRGIVRWASTLQGKIIGITGTIELYQGKPEIKITSADQIKDLKPQLVQ